MFLRCTSKLERYIVIKGHENTLMLHTYAKQFVQFFVEYLVSVIHQEETLV